MSVETKTDTYVERPLGLVDTYLLEKIKYNLRNIFPNFLKVGDDSYESFSYDRDVNGLMSTDHIGLIYREGFVCNSFYLALTSSIEIFDHKIKEVEASLVKYIILPDDIEIISEESYDSQKEQNDLNLWRIFRLLKKCETLFL